MVYTENFYELIINLSTNPEIRNIENNTDKNKVVIIKSVSNCTTQLSNGIFSLYPHYSEILYIDNSDNIRDIIYLSNLSCYTLLNRRVTLKPGEKIRITFAGSGTNNRYGSFLIAYSIIEDL